MRASAMRGLTIDELEARSDELDHDVIRTPSIDRFCSSSAWVLPAARALMPVRSSWILRGEAGWLVAMIGRHPAIVAAVLR